MDSVMSAVALRIYGGYQTAVNSYDFANQVMVNGSAYGTPQKLQTTGSLYRDLAGWAIELGIPKQYAIIYDALLSIEDSLEKINSQNNQRQGGTGTSSGGSAANGGKSTGSGAAVGDGKTPSYDSSGGAHYCLGVCL
jgi:hypothetical protein